MIIYVITDILKATSATSTFDMKPAKIVFISIVVLMAAVLSAPLWGGCNFNYQLCTSWCSIRHFNSSFDKIACKGSCSADKLSCLAK